LQPLLHGGEQEEKRRAGTENLAGVCGMAKAVELLTEDEREKRQKLYEQFTQKVLTTLDQAGVDYHVNGDLNNKLPHVLNLRFTGIVNDLLLMKLDLKGIAVSTGSACTAGTIDPSHVLEAMYGEGAIEVKESLRVSFGYGNTIEQVDYFAEQLVASLHELTK
jgi:cysteine desulfurase